MRVSRNERLCWIVYLIFNAICIGLSDKLTTRIGLVMMALGTMLLRHMMIRYAKFRRRQRASELPERSIVETLAEDEQSFKQLIAPYNAAIERAIVKQLDDLIMESGISPRKPSK